MNNAEVLIKFRGDDSDASSVEKQQEEKLKSLQKTGEAVAIGLAGAVDTLVGAFVGMGVNYNAEIETYLTRLETLTGSTDKANQILDQIKQDALKTPFDVASLTQAESLLLSTGVSAEQARKDVINLGNAISASGGGNVELQRMAVNLQQIKNVGKASSLDIKQFAYAGIDIYGLLADSMGITREEASSLGVTYEMLSTALGKASAEGGKYYGAMEKQSKTMKGASSNLQESWQVLAGTLSEGLFEAIKEIIPALTKMFDWLAKNKDIVMAIAIPLLTFINIIAGFFIIKKIITLIGAFNAVLLENPIVAIIALIVALVAGFMYLWNNVEGFRKFWINLWEEIKIAFGVAIEFLKNLIMGVINFIIGIPQTILTIVNSIKLFLSQIPYYVGYIIGYIFTKVYVFFHETIPNVITSFVEFLMSIPGKIWEIIVSVFNFLGEIPGYLAELWDKMKEWFIELKNKATEAFKNLINNIVSWFKELPGRMLDIGKNIVKGLWDGIKGMGNWIWEKITDFGNGILDGIKGALGIHSPSTEFAMVGKFSVLGYTEALDDMKGQVDKQIEDTFGISPQLANSSALHYSPNVVVNNEVNVSQDPLGQMVSNIKSYSGGAKNDYNFGMGV